ncbi:MAG: hypothetical protein WCB02_28790 [Bradyrhizobium sp.]
MSSFSDDRHVARILSEHACERKRNERAGMRSLGASSFVSLSVSTVELQIKKDFGRLTMSTVDSSQRKSPSRNCRRPRSAASSASDLDSFANTTLGYLCRHELDAASHILLPAKIRAQHMMLTPS